MQNSRIIQLDTIVANQIAAGEVVERPASVVKELLENSIDAGATKIEVEIEGGGIHLIRIRDNGIGIIHADLALAFSRHATSKIKTSEDLTSIQSLGFRGEALASIASVSHCRLVSRAIHQENAWQILIHPDLSHDIQVAAHPQGTTIEVADLFYNTPVRRKFLRSEKTEFQAIDDVLKRLSLTHPGISFSLKHQQRQIRSFMGVSSNQDESTRIAKICGQHFIDHAIAFSIENVGMQLKGWMSPSAFGHRQADCQYFFVNQRIIKDRLLSHALKMVYQQDPNYVEGTYPSYVIFLGIDPKEVDINVHPTKQEVRFSESRFVHDFITKCIEMALNKTSSTVAVNKTSSPLTESQSIGYKSNFPIKTSISQDINTATQAFYQACMPAPKSQLTVLKRYVLREDNEGIMLIDLQKAKTSLLSFYLEKQWEIIPKKSLLFPLSIELGAAINLTQEKLQLIKPLGLHFRLENKTLMLLEQPIFFNEDNIEVRLLNFIKGNTQWTRLSLCENLAKNLSLSSLDALLKTEFSEQLESWLEQNESSAWIKLSHEKIENFFEEA